MSGQTASCDSVTSFDQKAKVLLVDDQPGNLLALRAVLDELGQQLIDAQSGEECLRLAEEGEFAVVLLDVQMPGLSGFETARRMRAREQSRVTPIIFLTAQDSDQFPIEQAYALGAVDYMVKPLVPVVVKAKVAVFIDLFLKTQQVKRQGDQIRQMDRQSFEQRLAEENGRLRQSEARKAAILETALDCIITIDHQGKIVEFNPAAERLFGYAKDAVQGREISELIIPPRLRDAHRQGLARFYLTGEGPVLGKRIEMPALRSDGTEIPVEMAITCISTDGPPLFTAYLRDNSEPVRIERTRSARLAIAQVLAQAADVHEAIVGVLKAVCESLEWDRGYYWKLDPLDNLLHWTEGWRQTNAIYSEFEAGSRQRTFQRGEGLPGRVLATGKPAWIADVVQTENFPRADLAAKDGLRAGFACPITFGSTTLGVIEFFSRKVQVPDADLLEIIASAVGQIGQFVEQKRAEVELRESEQRFARFMQHLPGLAWIKDQQGQYVFANDAAQKAFRRETSDLYGKTDDELFSPETAALFKENDQRALTSGTGIQVVETLTDEAGVDRHSLVSKFPIFGLDGIASLVGGMAIDITDRLRAEEMLREADRRKDEFLATLAHELRNPLAPISNSLQILKLSRVDAVTLEQTRQMMERQVQSLARLVDDLLDVSRVMRGKIEMRCERVEVAAIVTRAAETARPLIDAQGHELTIDLPLESLLLYADPLRLSQVIGNLLVNAAKYSEPRGKIRLVAQRQGDEAVINVRDEGIGIPPEMLSRIFELFVQVDHSSSRTHGGLGIGLTLVQSLVAMHQGKVEARSEGIGKGSEFEVRLPLLMESGPEAVVMSDRPRRALHCGHRLLVVDDNKDAAVSLAMLLRFLGHEVAIAHDGPTALEVAKSHSPSMVFLDLGMPEMDGYEVAQRMRQEPGLKRVVLAALTGWGQEEDRRRTKQAGFDYHLVKPIESRKLDEVLAELTHLRTD